MAILYFYWVQWIGKDIQLAQKERIVRTYGLQNEKRVYNSFYYNICPGIVQFINMKLRLTRLHVFVWNVPCKMTAVRRLSQIDAYYAKV